MKITNLLLNSFFFNISETCRQTSPQTGNKQESPVNFQQPDRRPIHKHCISCIIVFIVCFFFSKETIAQTNPEYTRSYLNNLVEIGLSDYGLITAEDSTQLYFIAVRRSLTEKKAFPEKIANSIKQVKFYGNAYKAKATKVKEVRFGAFTVVLYKSLKPSASLWQKSYYHTLAYKKGKFSTFRDKWLSDKIWAVQEGKISVVKQPKGGIVILRVPLDAGIAKGMPLINSDGFIGGIFAESTLGKSVVKVINMKEIADALYISGGNNCHYFNIVEWGKTDIRCILEENEKLAAEEKARNDAEAKAKRAMGKQPKKAAVVKDTTEQISQAPKVRKKHFLDYGINGNIITNPVMDNTNGKDNYLKTRAYHVGLSLHLNIDKKGMNRITLKPRYGNFYERKDAGLWTSADNEVTLVTTSYQYAEMPVVLERQLFSGNKFSVAIGAGYSPGWVFGHQYSWLDKTATDPVKESVSGPGTAIMHRITGELYLYEFKFGRMGIIYTKDMTGYPHAGYKLSVNGTDYLPFESRKKAWYIGVELGIRLRGGWGR
ncbi:MAG TPA: hypothetical protein VJ111_17400 [Chitinophagaceae bacterium]|nr:hypothetical protein [Chitinophagaceae bacterium]